MDERESRYHAGRKGRWMNAYGPGSENIECLERFTRNDNIVLLGDLNAKVGNLPSVNENGRKIGSVAPRGI